jgi:thiol-disulfide isomerase/thioredoxin
MNDHEHDSLAGDITDVLTVRAQDVDDQISSRLLNRLTAALEDPTRLTTARWNAAAIGSVAAVLVLIALVPVLISSTSGKQQREEPVPPPSTQPANAVPVVLSGKSLDDKPTTTAGYLGQPLIVTLWGSWCAPCRDQVADLSKIGGIQVLGVSVNEPDRAQARALESDVGLTFPTLYELDEQSKDVLASVGSGGYPVTLLLDADGQISTRWDGSVSDTAVLDAVERLQTDQQVVLLTSRSERGGRDALISGPLSLVGNCAGIGDAVAVWPQGTTIAQERPLVLDIPGLGTVDAGEQLTGAGGNFDTATDDVPLRLPRSCQTTTGVTFRLE